MISSNGAKKLSLAEVGRIVSILGKLFPAPIARIMIHLPFEVLIGLREHFEPRRVVTIDLTDGLDQIHKGFIRRERGLKVKRFFSRQGIFRTDGAALAIPHEAR